MSDLIGQNQGQFISEQPACRVAYTLNNDQPVLCTIIGDQPLFYMDDISEDDIAFDEAELGLLEDELKTLKKSMEAFDRQYAELASEMSESSTEFFDTSLSFGDANKATQLEEILDILTQSRLAAAYLDCAKEHNIEISYSSDTETSFYDRKSGEILLNPHQPAEDIILGLVTELRRHFTHRQGAMIHPLMFHPDHAILVNRAQAADLAVSMIRVAWELQLSGAKSVWARLESSTLSDLTRSFAREAFMDFRTINNGVASASVFETWFLSERCRGQDKEIIQQMLADYQGYVFDNENESKSVTADLIAALGAQPYGKNYLAQHAMTIMSDPIFTDIRDRSNANFLWFIKFERTFRETEQELQNSGGQSEAGVLHASSSDQKGKQNGQFTQDGKSAEIIQLFHSSEETGNDSPEGSESGKILRSRSKRKSVEDGQRDNVVFLHRQQAD